MTTLFVASTGGHLAELVRLSRRLELDDDAVWVTFDTPQSRSLLGGERVVHVPYTAPREYRRVLTNLWPAAGILHRTRPARVISTGAAVALSFLPPARLARIPCDYIESAARSEGPSATGSLLARVPGIRLHTQYPGWADDRWRYSGSIFDDFRAEQDDPPPQISRIVVSLGTIPYSFRRLVDRLLAIVPPDVEILWQTGHTDVGDLPIEGHVALAPEVLEQAIADADVVVTHAGIGSALSALEAGRCPVLVPREHAHGEHVDDHQALIVAELESRRIAVGRRVSELTWDDVVAAAARRVQAGGAAAPIAL